jgi:hypothetical protein
MIESNYDKTINTQRLTDESGDREYFDDFLTGVACHMQPLEESFTEDLDGNFGKDWIMFCAVLDIKEGDRIIDGTDEYKVVGVESFNFLDEDRHMEIRIRKWLK